MLSRYPIKSTTTADRIRRAFPRLKVLKTVVKRLEPDPLILGLSEGGGGGGGDNGACTQEPEISHSVFNERNKMSSVSVLRSLAEADIREVNRRGTQTTRDNFGRAVRRWVRPPPPRRPSG